MKKRPLDQSPIQLAKKAVLDSPTKIQDEILTTVKLPDPRKEVKKEEKKDELLEKEEKKDESLEKEEKKDESLEKEEKKDESLEKYVPKEVLKVDPKKNSIKKDILDSPPKTTKSVQSSPERNTQKTPPGKVSPKANIPSKQNSGDPPNALQDLPKLEKRENPDLDQAPKKLTRPRFEDSPFGTRFGASSNGFGQRENAPTTFAELLQTPIKDQVEEEDRGTPPSPTLKKSAIAPIIHITGEEEETTHKTIHCKLFAWEDENWKERGSGLLKLNQKDGDARLVMRTDLVFRLILNVRIIPDLPCILRNEKYLELAACEKPNELTKFLIRFKRNEEAQDFMDEIKRLKQ